MRTLLLCFDFQGALSEEQLAQVRAAAPDMRVLVANDREEIESVLDEVEIAYGSFPLDLLPKARNLRWFLQQGAGATWLLQHPEIAELDFELINTSGVHAIPISEHILALMLAFARKLHRAVRHQQQRAWVRQYPHDDIFELAGKTMVLIGVGAVGQRTAQVSTALGMRVLGVRRNPTLEVADVARMFGPAQLLDILPEADFVVLTIPLTEETRGMIGERELRAMKPSAFIINSGRGGTIQENVLIQALGEGWIAGAGLDVCESEPPPDDSPLWTMDNVILTGHYAGTTPHHYERALEILLDNLRRYRSGQALRNVVDKRLAY